MRDMLQHVADEDDTCHISSHHLQHIHEGDVVDDGCEDRCRSFDECEMAFVHFRPRRRYYQSITQYIYIHNHIHVIATMFDTSHTHFKSLILLSVTQQSRASTEIDKFLPTHYSSSDG